MADEFARKTHMVRVTNPNDSTQFVDVKIIDSISFNDQHEQSQDTIFRFDNSSGNTFRETRTQTVVGSDGVSTVDVQRVLAFTEIDQHDRGQETRYRENGAQEPPTHLKTHTVKIHNPDNMNLWLVLQRADSVDFLDAHENGQETIFRLNWPDDDESNPSNVDTSSDGTQINPPWRLDPFQDIIDVSWHAQSGSSGGPGPGQPIKFEGVFGAGVDNGDGTFGWGASVPLSIADAQGNRYDLVGPETVAQGDFNFTDSFPHSGVIGLQYTAVSTTAVRVEPSIYATPPYSGPDPSIMSFSFLGVKYVGVVFGQTVTFTVTEVLFPPGHDGPGPHVGPCTMTYGCIATN